jgi:hypothetical protein
MKCPFSFDEKLPHPGTNPTIYAAVILVNLFEIAFYSFTRYFQSTFPLSYGLARHGGRCANSRSDHRGLRLIAHALGPHILQRLHK